MIDGRAVAAIRADGRRVPFGVYPDRATAEATAAQLRALGCNAETCDVTDAPARPGMALPKAAA